jgi:hypothetical protein
MAVVEEVKLDERREAVTTLLSCGTLRGAYLKRGCESRLPALILGEPGRTLGSRDRDNIVTIFSHRTIVVSN